MGHSRRSVCVLAVTALTAACASRAPVSPAHVPAILGTEIPACVDPAADGKCRLYVASFIQLIARPEAYDGKRIVVRGFVNLEFEGNALYLSEELRRYGNTRDAVWLDVTNISPPPRFRQGYALVEGMFKA